MKRMNTKIFNVSDWNQMDPSTAYIVTIYVFGQEITIDAHVLKESGGVLNGKNIIVETPSEDLIAAIIAGSEMNSGVYIHDISEEMILSNTPITCKVGGNAAVIWEPAETTLQDLKELEEMGQHEKETRELWGRIIEEEDRKNGLDK